MYKNEDTIFQLMKPRQLSPKQGKEIFDGLSTLKYPVRKVISVIVWLQMLATSWATR